MNKAARNERMKLTATMLNTVASGCLVVGVITPTAALWYGLGQISASPLLAVAGGAIFFAVGVGLHLVARRILEELLE